MTTEQPAPIPTEAGQEQAHSQAAAPEPNAAHGDIPLSERRSDTDCNQYKRSIYALNVPLTVVLGTARPTIAELLKLKQDSLLPLDSKIDDPVELCINDRVIARGELIETDPASGAIGVRLTEIVDISEDLLQ